MIIIIIIIIYFIKNRSFSVLPEVEEASPEILGYTYSFSEPEPVIK